MPSHSSDPDTTSPDSAQVGADDFRRLFIEAAPFIDLRAPTEFEQGAFPSAVNLPLMTDDERAQVGTCYKRKGQPAAIELGHSLVSGATRDARMHAWQNFAKNNPNCHLYCFRGGLRSQIVQSWLADAGVHIPRISGGYKALRQFLIGTLEDAANSLNFIVVGGRTGSGKTKVLQQMPRAIDLEGLANHRGSAFGSLLTPQPKPITFENQLAIALLRLGQTPGPIFLEDECQLIGRIAIPHPLHQRMKQVPFIELAVTFDDRVQGVLEDYITDLGKRYADTFPDDGALRHRARLLEDLSKIQRRLGGDRYNHTRTLMTRAFDRQEHTGATDAHADWIAILLRDYYDPMYDFQMSKRSDLRQSQMSQAELIEWSRQWAPQP